MFDGVHLTLLIGPLAVPVPAPLPPGEKPHILALSPAHNISDEVRQGERKARLATWDKLRDEGLLRGSSAPKVRRESARTAAGR